MELNIYSKLKESIYRIFSKFCKNKIKQDIYPNYEKNYLSLVEECSIIINQLEEYQSRINNDESLQLISLFRSQLLDALILSGTTPINNDSTFDIIKHCPQPMSVVKPGTPIDHTIEPGILFNEKIYVKAKVSIKQPNKHEM